jgi:uncharacterized protein (DUF1684 family)
MQDPEPLNRKEGAVAAKAERLLPAEEIKEAETQVPEVLLAIQEEEIMVMEVDITVGIAMEGDVLVSALAVDISADITMVEETMAVVEKAEAKAVAAMLCEEFL